MNPSLHLNCFSFHFDNVSKKNPLPYQTLQQCYLVLENHNRFFILLDELFGNINVIVAERYKSENMRRITNPPLLCMNSGGIVLHIRHATNPAPNFANFFKWTV